jgi:hypothetical protein
MIEFHSPQSTDTSKTWLCIDGFFNEEHYHVAVSALLCIARFIVAFLPMSNAVSAQSFCLDYYMF